MRNEQQNGVTGIYRASSQQWFRSAFALLLALPFVIPGGAVLAAFPQILFLCSLSFWGHVKWAAPPWWPGLWMYVVLHLGCVVPLWLAFSEHRRIRLALGRKDICVEEGRICLNLVKWAVAIVVVGVVGGGVLTALGLHHPMGVYSQGVMFLYL